jgi:hypothetical protein
MIQNSSKIVTIENSDTEEFNQDLQHVYKNLAVNETVVVLGFNTQCVGAGCMVRKTIVLEIQSN